MGDRELIEQARAGLSAFAYGLGASMVKKLADRLEALAGPPEREGWVLVPKEPTREMERAAFDALELSPGVGGHATGTHARNAVWTAMLSAAPKPQDER